MRLVSAICVEISDDWESGNYNYELGANLQKKHLHCRQAW